MFALCGTLAWQDRTSSASTPNGTVLFGRDEGNDGGWRFYLPLVVMPLGFVLCAWPAHAFFLGSQGRKQPFDGDCNDLFKVNFRSKLRVRSPPVTA